MAALRGPGNAARIFGSKGIYALCAEFFTKRVRFVIVMRCGNLLRNTGGTPHRRLPGIVTAPATG